MAINIYEPRFMLDVIKKVPPKRTFMRDTFFSSHRKFYQEKVMFDIVKKGNQMAPVVHPRVGSKNLERSGFKTFEFTPPLVAPKRTLTTDDIDYRLPGEALFDGYHPDKRAVELLAEDLIELLLSIDRREEWMCCQVLYNGRLLVVGEGVRYEIDFEFENRISVAVTWDDHDNSKPIDDLIEAADLVAEANLTPDMAIGDTIAMRHLIRNKNVKDLLDRENYKMGNIDPRSLSNGVMYYGYLQEPGLHLFGYNGKFADYDNENPKYPGIKPDDKGFIPSIHTLVPAGKVMVTSREMQANMLYGCVKDLKIGSFAEPRVPKQWEQDEPSIKFLKVSSRPLPCPKDLDSWVVLDVL